MKMSLSQVLMKAWRVPVLWLLAISVLVSLFTGATAQCSSVNRPLILSSVNESTNILSTDHLYLPTRNINCEWKIIAKEGDRIALTVMNIDLIDSYNCLSQSLKIFDGETEYNRNLGIFCGRQRGQILFSLARFMLIKFISSGSLATGGFNLSYTKASADPACSTGTRPTRLTGHTAYFMELHFPVYSTNYSNNALCDWLISVPSGYVVNLLVHSVNMEVSNNCTKDRVDINDGTTIYSPLLARICRNYLQSVNSTGTDMLIHFTSGNSTTRAGFSVSYKAILKSNVIATRDAASRSRTQPTHLTGSIYSFTELRFPSSGTTFTNNALCEWLISVPIGYIVQLRLNSVNMETDSGCTRDRMDIYDGSSVYSHLLARICNYTQLNVYSSGTYMFIQFTSKVFVAGTGFGVSYKAIRVSSLIKTTVAPPYDDESSPSWLAITGGVIGGCMVLGCIGGIISECRKKSSESTTRRSRFVAVFIAFRARRPEMQ